MGVSMTAVVIRDVAADILQRMRKEPSMFTDPEGPIERFDWGEFTIAGRVHGAGGRGAGKDVRVIGTEVTPWKERKGHVLSPPMISGVYGQGIETLIIGNGVHGMLECPQEIRDAVEAHGIPDLRVLRTPDACRLYNQLVRDGRKVALLAHGTC